MKFNIDYNGKTEQRVLIYDTDGLGFFVDPMEEKAMFSFSLNYLCLTTIEEDNSVAEVDGFCPYGGWIKTNRSVPQNKPGKLKITDIDDLDPQPGIVYGINDAHWPVYVNPNTGWVCVGNPEKSGEAVEFISGCVAVIDANSNFLSLWLKPKELPIACIENAIHEQRSQND